MKRHVAPLIAAVVFIPTYFGYLATHEIPGGGGGLFLSYTSAIIENGYVLPRYITQYSMKPIPAAYPPLGFYMTAFLTELGLSPIDTAVYVPGIYVVVGLFVGTWGLQYLLDDYKAATIAGVVLATTPTALFRLLGGGGIVRGLAFVLMMASFYPAYQIFYRGNREYVVIAGILFGLTILTHYLYAIFFGLTYVAIFFTNDQSRSGFIYGLAVSLMGLLLSAPWILTVLRYHGIDVFVNVSGTHGGLLSFTWPINFLASGGTPTPLWPVLVGVGSIYFVIKQEWLPVTWLLLTGTIVGKFDITYIPGAVIVGLLGSKLFLPAVAESHKMERVGSRFVNRIVVALNRSSSNSTYLTNLETRQVYVLLFIIPVIAYSMFVAVPYYHHSPSENFRGFESYADSYDYDAMQWVAQHTESDDSVVVVGDASEWLPVIANRTTEVVVRGTEFQSPNHRHRQAKIRNKLTGCLSVRCLVETIQQYNLSSKYLYIPKDGHVLNKQRGKIAKLRWSRISADADAHATDCVTYRNDEVIIFDNKCIKKKY